MNVIIKDYKDNMYVTLTARLYLLLMCVDCTISIYVYKKVYCIKLHLLMYITSFNTTKLSILLKSCLLISIKLFFTNKLSNTDANNLLPIVIISSSYGNIKRIEYPIETG